MMFATTLIVSLAVLAGSAAQPGGTPTAKPDGATPATPDTPPPVKDISAELASIPSEFKVPGIAAAAIENGRVVAVGVAGVRQLGSPEPIGINDKFHLGSCTKSMTATLAGLCVERGEITWDATLSDIFRDVPMKEGWRRVTLRQLMQHRGMVPNDLSQTGLGDQLWSTTGTPAEQRVVFVKALLSWTPEGAPGEKYEYANGSFVLAGAMLERVTKRDWEDLIRERIFEPLGLTTAGFGAPGTPDTLDQPRGHRGGVAIQPGPDADNPEVINPAGRVHMSIGDWAKYLAVHASAARGTQRLLRPETAKALQEWPVEGDYGMGWSFTKRPWAHGDLPEDFGKVLNHNGSNNLWFSVCWLAPERNLGMLAVSNQGDGRCVVACDRAVVYASRYVNGAKSLSLTQPIPSFANRPTTITPPTVNPNAPR